MALHLDPGKPGVSVIVPVYQDPRLSLCLDALQQQCYTGPIEVIVVNNGMPGSVPVPLVSNLDIRVIDEAQPGSYNARNAGLRVARGEILAFTDSDCVPDAGWLSAGVACLLEDSARGLVGGRITIVPGKTPNMFERYEATVSFPQKRYIEQWSFAATANMLARRNVFATVGAFSGSLRSGGDADWGQRVASAGFALHYCDAAVVQHPARRSYKELVGKVRRTVAGERDRHPSSRSCARFCLEALSPPFRPLKRMWRDRPAGTGTLAFFCLASIMIALRWRAAYERLRLQIAKSASPR